MNRSFSIRRVATLLGPAFVAAVAYVDPGNFAANFSAGATYGYQLLWVLVAANIMAGIVQYQSAKLGLVTGRSLPQVVGQRLSKWPRVLFWLQAELIAIATDIAEVIGGAIGLAILFNVPLLIGAVITGVVSMILLLIYHKHDTRLFERVIIGLLLIIPLGFVAGLFLKPPDAADVMRGLVPTLNGGDMTMLAVAMLGATVMPHVIYLHSALSRDHFSGLLASESLVMKLRDTKFDVVVAMFVAGSVNIAMLLLAASSLQGIPGGENILSIHAAIGDRVSGVVATLFGVSLLISGFASTAVGAQAGAVIMKDMIGHHVPLWLRRTITIAPAIIIVALGLDPTVSLIVSQVALSFGVPFALVALAAATSSRDVMGDQLNSRLVTYAVYAIAALISLLNLGLIVSFIA